MDILQLHTQALEQVGDVVANIKPDQLDNPTPCPDWTVREELAHLINGNLQWVPGGGGPFAAMGVPENSDEILGDDYVAAYNNSATINSDGWNAPGVIDEPIETPHGAISADARLQAHLSELLMHGWDLARATNQTPVFDDAMVSAANEYAQKNMPVERDGKFFGVVQEVPANASAIDQLAGFMGRAV